jgi:hypothetical protein
MIPSVTVEQLAVSHVIKWVCPTTSGDLQLLGTAFLNKKQWDI